MAELRPLFVTQVYEASFAAERGFEAFNAELAEACQMLHTKYKIGHSTLQVEVDEGFACPLEPDHVV